MANSLELTPESLDLGKVPVGAMGEGTIDIFNLDPASPVLIERLEVRGDGFEATIPGLAQIDPGESISVVVRFRPTAEGPASAELAISATGATEPVAFVAVSADGVGDIGDSGGCSAADGSFAIALAALLVLRGRRRRREWS